MKKIVPLAQKLQTIEDLIFEHRHGRAEPGTRGHTIYVTLCAIAIDLRAAGLRDRGAIETNIDRRIAALSDDPQNPDRIDALAHEVVKNWPTIRQALSEKGA